MNNNFIVKILCSLPVVLIITYFIPFLGIILILFKFLIFSKKRYSTAISLLVIGLLLLLPKILDYLLKIIKIKVNIPYLSEIINSSIYHRLINLGKLFIIVGIILIIISYIGHILGEKIGTKIGNYFKEEQRKEYEISEKNDLKMQEKREIAKNTHFVKCPNCGGDNTVIGNVGKCKFCRKDIEYKI